MRLAWKIAIGGLVRFSRFLVPPEDGSATHVVVRKTRGEVIVSSRVVVRSRAVQLHEFRMYR